MNQRTIVSRRTRPAKEALSRDVIVSTALSLLTAENAESLSLRKVATALDTGAASLYVYVANVEELRSLVLDAFVGSIDLPFQGSGDWRARVKALLGAYLGALQQHPALADLARTTVPAGPSGLRLVETLLDLLITGGVSPGGAAWAVDLLLAEVTNVAAERNVGSSEAAVLAPAERAIDSIMQAEFPRLHALREDLFSGSGSDRFGWAIDVLLNGILSTPRTPAVKKHQSPRTEAPRPGQKRGSRNTPGNR
jgi:AcrR family transcriptional regulator